MVSPKERWSFLRKLTFDNIIGGNHGKKVGKMMINAKAVLISVTFFQNFDYAKRDYGIFSFNVQNFAISLLLHTNNNVLFYLQASSNKDFLGKLPSVFLFCFQ